jgi:hypothetical protein
MAIVARAAANIAAVGAYLGVLERERSTCLALTQLGQVAGPGGEEHLPQHARVGPSPRLARRPATLVAS